ncbi:EAL and HDOD domain-containing protein [Chromatocurvus halotolerans]|uniref:Diguanylate phosphodiesterase n=1 Tax=Chromatocurvus halotolerans TaxID=1132028 RepID=A0A4R2K9E0_9GAMM|nr:HDOD domain-containing protein [Chromatocurvus halotolerans]TCO69334.1 diguanylate phosphodiesterase [Chromatocurvus halotolerans]
MTPFFLARQPIFNRQLEVYAYELLFRDSLDNAHGGTVDDDASTARVIANATELGLETLTRGRQAFINLPQRFLEDPELIPLDPSWMVPEILETVILNDACIAGIRRLQERGFCLALDDFVDTTDFDAILPLVDIVKLDVLALPEAQWATQIDRLRKHDCQILAEKVETLEAYETLHALGVEYFQGYFFARPKIVEGRQLPPARVTLLQTLARLNDPQSSVEDVHQLVSRDVALSVKALKHVNSAAQGLNRHIETIREAIVYLGRNTIRRWVSLYLLASTDTGPEENLTLALQRAKLCELIADHTGRGNPEACFTAGLYSMLDALMNAPLPDLLRHMNLADDMRAALLSRSGDTGKIIDCAQRLESGDIPEQGYLRLSLRELGSLQADALRWTDDALRDLGIE